MLDLRYNITSEILDLRIHLYGEDYRNRIQHDYDIEEVRVALEHISNEANLLKQLMLLYKLGNMLYRPILRTVEKIITARSTTPFTLWVQVFNNYTTYASYIGKLQLAPDLLADYVLDWNYTPKVTHPVDNPGMKAFLLKSLIHEQEITLTLFATINYYSKNIYTSGGQIYLNITAKINPPKPKQVIEPITPYKSRKKRGVTK